jgi:toxin ParE1/3/4
VAAFRFSRRAEGDLLGIGMHTLRTWGEVQAVRYLNELEACCQMLVDNPELGRACEHIRPGLRRMESRKHVVFYRRESKGILVVRILHRHMLPERQAIDDEDEPTVRLPPSGKK